MELKQTKLAAEGSHVLLAVCETCLPMIHSRYAIRDADAAKGRNTHLTAGMGKAQSGCMFILWHSGFSSLD